MLPPYLRGLLGSAYYEIINPWQGCFDTAPLWRSFLYTNSPGHGNQLFCCTSNVQSVRPQATQCRINYELEHHRILIAAPCQMDAYRMRGIWAHNAQNILALDPPEDYETEICPVSAGPEYQLTISFLSADGQAIFLNMFYRQQPNIEELIK